MKLVSQSCYYRQMNASFLPEGWAVPLHPAVPLPPANLQLMYLFISFVRFLSM
jgi:hypothetical protein